MEQGPTEAKILPNVIKLGLPIPKSIANAPSLSLGLEVFYEAYLDLCTTRGGMGDGPIPWHHAMAYAKAVGMEEEQAEELWYYVTQMDEAWLKYQEQKRTKK